jgi:hypothetical protein
VPSHTPTSSAESVDVTWERANSAKRPTGRHAPAEQRRTLAEIVDKMSWQKQIVRGFMAGAMKKTGYSPSNPPRAAVPIE